MASIAQIVSEIVYAAIGAVSASMAGKCLLSGKYLPFHEKAAGRQWDELEPNVQSVVLALLRLTGLGFLVVALLLLPHPFFALRTTGLYLTVVIPFISLLFCIGLSVVNYRLSAETGASTPWKGSLYASLLIAFAVGVSIAGW
jgi:hypothetical protein